MEFAPDDVDRRRVGIVESGMRGEQVIVVVHVCDLQIFMWIE